MIKILFVCLGNICRSPMAELLLRDLVEKRGVQDEFFIRSAAISDEEVGNPVYPPVRKRLEAEGISCARKRAVQLTRADYTAYDLLIGMERSHLRAMQRLFGGDPAGKLRLLADYTARPHDIADPWYTRDFETAERDIRSGCEGLLEQLADRLNNP